jgi:hypothetical protein
MSTSAFIEGIRKAVSDVENKDFGIRTSARYRDDSFVNYTLKKKDTIFKKAPKKFNRIELCTGKKGQVISEAIKILATNSPS